MVRRVAGEGSRRRRAGRRRIGVGIALVALLALTGCNEILVNMAAPGWTDTSWPSTSVATFEVVPTTTLVGGRHVEALDVQFSNCDAIRFTNVPPEAPEIYQVVVPLHHQAAVFDANGTWVDPGYLAPIEGYADLEDPIPSHLDHIIVPVAGFTPPFQVLGLCSTNSYGTSIQGPYMAWYPAPCTTKDDACPLTRGDGEFRYRP